MSDNTTQNTSTSRYGLRARLMTGAAALVTLLGGGAMIGSLVNTGTAQAADVGQGVVAQTQTDLAADDLALERDVPSDPLGLQVERGYGHARGQHGRGRAYSQDQVASEAGTLEQGEVTGLQPLPEVESQSDLPAFPSAPSTGDSSSSVDESAASGSSDSSTVPGSGMRSGGS